MQGLSRAEAKELGAITRNVDVNAKLTENAEGRRWAEVQFDDVCDAGWRQCALVDIESDRLVRYEESKIMALASSIYINRDGVWNLAFHQRRQRIDDLPVEQPAKFERRE